MKRRNRLGTLGSFAGILIASAFCSSAMGEGSSSTQPSPDVAAILAKLDARYSGLKSAQFDGHIVGRFDIGGEQKTDDIPFTSSFRAPNQFKHNARGDVLLGSTGQTAYAFQPGRNVYISADAPKDRADLSAWPRAVSGILQQQNPSLLLALTKNPGDGLKDLGQDMKRLADSNLDGAAFPTIQFDLPPEHQVVTMLIDPKTSLLRQVRFDLRKSMEARGATDVKSAEVTVDYTVAKAAVDMDQSTFDWSPPAGATQATTPAPSDPTGDSDAASALVGKAAPDFTLSGLDDQPVKVSGLKGSVVILDFWATWCGPCVASLPHLDELYKEQSPNGLKVFAVNLQEEKDAVKAFVQKKQWSLPVLLDLQGDVAKQYGADAIPETVIIGKDGTVKQVFVGSGHEDDIKAVVAKEMGN